MRSRGEAPAHHCFTREEWFVRLMNMVPAGKANSRKQAAERTSLITSHDNRWLKRFRASLAGEQGNEDGLAGVEGVRLVEAALGSGLPVMALLVSDSGQRD